VISNKYNPEWSEKVPRNFLSLSFIKKFFEKFHNDYKIYYIRYDGGGKDTEGYYDDVGSLEFKDWDIVKQFKGISTVYDVMNEYDIGFNRAQFWIHSMAEHTVSCAGGNAVLSAYFGNDVLIYGHPNCKSTPRGIWKTNSWLTKLGCKKVMGTQNYEQLLQMCEIRWLD